MIPKAGSKFSLCSCPQGTDFLERSLSQELFPSHPLPLTHIGFGVLVAGKKEGRGQWSP